MPARAPSIVLQQGTVFAGEQTPPNLSHREEEIGLRSGIPDPT
jgi:hypothetical protein